MVGVARQAAALSLFLLGSAATWIHGGSESAVLASEAIVVASTGMIVATKRVGLVSLGGATLAISLLAFWLKWILNSRPSSERVMSFDNDGAIAIYAVFLVAFAAMWHLKARREQGHHLHCGGDTGAAQVEHLLPLILGVVGFALVALRSYLASHYRIGVPGETPLVASGSFRIFGLAYYLSTYGPLLVSGVLLLTRRRGGGRFFVGLAVLITYVIVGVELGYRSYGVTAATVVIYCVQAAPGRRIGRNGATASTFLMSVAAALAAVLSVGEALKTRQSSSVNPLQFIGSRVGGLDYLSPVVSTVDHYEPSWSNLNPATWNEFVKVVVYHFPQSVTNGLSATLPGWLYGIDGLLAVATGGLLAGYLAGWVDLRHVNSGNDLASQVAQLGWMLAWMNLLLEGTVLVTVYMAVAFGLTGLCVRMATQSHRSSRIGGLS